LYQLTAGFGVPTTQHTRCITNPLGIVRSRSGRRNFGAFDGSAGRRFWPSSSTNTCSSWERNHRTSPPTIHDHIAFARRKTDDIVRDASEVATVLWIGVENCERVFFVQIVVDHAIVCAVRQFHAAFVPRDTWNSISLMSP
jgi:hypothetical protein